MWTTRWIVLAALVGLVGTAQAADPKLDEAQALGAVLVMNGTEMAMGTTMAARAQDPEVRAYAMRLIEDHGDANMKLLNYQEQAGLKAKDSKVRNKTLSEGIKMTDALWSREMGAELDQRFLTDAITEHKETLESFDTMLIPAAQNERLKTLFTQQRDAVSAHLAQACTLGKRLGAGTEGCPQAEPGTR